MIGTKTTQVAARANMKAMGEYEYHKNVRIDPGFLKEMKQVIALLA